MTTPDTSDSTIEATTYPDLETAIAQAVLQHQQERAAQAEAAQAERQAAEQTAIERFQLPFDPVTVAVLPALNFRFEGETRDLKTTVWFEYKDLTITIRYVGWAGNTETWHVGAARDTVSVLENWLYVYPSTSYVGYKTPEQRGQDFLVCMDTAANTPTPVLTPRETGTFDDFRDNRRQRERFIKAALQGTLIGITHTGLNAEASLQAALFALDTADQVLSLMHATTLQRQVLKVLTIEQFTNWLNTRPYGDVVGSLNPADHPLCRYVQERCGIMLTVSNRTLYDEASDYVLGNDNVSKHPHELPLELAGAWLPALLDWKTFDADTDASYPTFMVGEVLRFLEPFQP